MSEVAIIWHRSEASSSNNRCRFFCVEFGCRIVQEQYRTKAQLGLNQLELRDDHGHGGEFLLPTRERLPGDTLASPQDDIGAMGSGLSSCPGFDLDLRVHEVHPEAKSPPPTQS